MVTYLGSPDYKLWSHDVQNYANGGTDCEHNQGKETKEKPGGAATGLVAGLGDAEGSKEGGCKCLKELHESMVRGAYGVRVGL
jgi:hypothetical protein